MKLFAISVNTFKPYILSKQSIKIDTMTEIRKILGANMKAYRAEHGYSQAKLAELVNTATNYIAQIENGKRFPTDIMLEKIASALQKKAYEMFSVNHYERKIKEDWQIQILSDLENFIHKKLLKIRSEHST